MDTACKAAAFGKLRVNFDERSIIIIIIVIIIGIDVYHLD